MGECFISSNVEYTYDNDKYSKNGISLLNEEGTEIDEVSFKRLIQKETSNFE